MIFCIGRMIWHTSPPGIISEEVCVKMSLLATPQSIDAEPNREKLEPLVHEGSTALLHQVDDHRALLLLVPIVGVLERDHELGVHGEGGQVVPATPSTLPWDPGSGEGGHLPLERAAVVQGVRGQVGHLQLVKVLEEILQGHPPLPVRLKVDPQVLFFLVRDVPRYVWDQKKSNPQSDKAYLHSGDPSDQAPFHSTSLPQGFLTLTRGISPDTLGVSILAFTTWAKFYARQFHIRQHLGEAVGMTPDQPDIGSSLVDVGVRFDAAAHKRTTVVGLQHYCEQVPGNKHMKKIVTHETSLKYFGIQSKCQQKGGLWFKQFRN